MCVVYFTLTFQGGRAAPGQLESVSVTAQGLLLIEVHEFPEGAKGPLGTAQDVLPSFRLHDLTVFVINHGFMLHNHKQANIMAGN